MIGLDRSFGVAAGASERNWRTGRRPDVMNKDKRTAARGVTFAVFLCATVLASHDAHAQMMSLPGGFNVTESGAATYSIPISVPPGTAGMVPSLSLDYSSQSGTGLVGVGWALSGLPSIGRCPRTQAQDGARGAVKYDLDDRFCMEGQRLVLVSGTYGAANSEYRTEIEGFSKVTAKGSAGNGPAWFEVKTKSGQVLEFGNTTDSRILAQGIATARSWAMNKATDAAGNYLTVSYTNNNNSGQAYPTRVDYTGNDAASLVPYNSVRFVYETRPDIVRLFHGGSLQRNTVRLTRVRTYEGNNVVADYRLAYETGSATGRSRLVSVTLCSGTSGGAPCLPGSTFNYSDVTYENGGPAGITSQNGAILRGQDWEMLYGDFNGDGRTDALQIYYESAQTWLRRTRIVHLSNGDGTFQQLANPAGRNSWFLAQSDEDHPNAADYDFLIGDFNGDGLSDIFLTPHPHSNGQCPSGNNFTGPWPASPCSKTFIWFSNGDGTFQEMQTAAPPSVAYNNNRRRVAVIADLDGDARSDILWLEVQTGTGYRGSSGTFNRGKVVGPMVPWISNGDGTFTVKPGVAVGANFSSIGRVQGAEDFNGDGKADFLFVNQTLNSVSRTIYHSKGDGTFDVLTNVAGADGSFVDFALSFGDFNGDGMTDIFRTNGTNRGLWLSKGDGTFQNFGNLNDANGTMTSWLSNLVDFNGDGRTDILFINANTSAHRTLWRSKGDGTFDVFTNLGGFDGVAAGDMIVPVELNGDGTADLLLGSSSGFNINAKTWLSNPEPNDLLVSFSTGLGSSTEITYDSLSRNFPACVVVWIPICTPYLYEKDADAVYPLIDLQGPLQVVQSIEADDGVGGTYRSEYFYRGAKASLDGRGFLGFREWTVTDPQTEVVQVTEYLQSFPHIGLIGKQTKKRGTQKLNELTNSWTSVSHDGGARRRVLLEASVEASFDLDGSAIPPVTTSYTYDSYSNPTEVVVSTPDGASKVTANTYTNDTANWWLGRLTRSEVTSTVP